MNKLAIVIFTIFFSCVSEKKFEVDTESNQLNDLINISKISTINTESIKTDTVFVEEHISFESSVFLDNKVFVTDLIGINITESNSVIFNRNFPFIINHNEDSDSLKVIGKEGKGPNEYSEIKNVVISENYNYAVDPSNSRISKLDKNFDFINVFTNEKIDFQTSQSEYSIFKDDLVLPIKNNEKYLAGIFNNKNGALKASFLPRLIPIGKQPAAVNNYKISSSKNGKMGLAYFGLPYIILFDENLKAVQTIIIQSEEIKEKTSSLKPIEDNSGLGVGVSQIIFGIEWIDDSHLMVFRKNMIYILQEIQGSFNLINKVKLEYSDEALAKKHKIYGVKFRVTDISNDFMYVSSNFDTGIYSLPLDKLLKN